MADTNPVTVPATKKKLVMRVQQKTIGDILDATPATVPAVTMPVPTPKAPVAVVEKVEPPKTNQPLKLKKKSVNIDPVTMEEAKVQEKPKKEEITAPAENQKLEITSEMISYFLDKQFDIEIESKSTSIFDLNSSLIRFLNRAYEVQEGKDIGRNNNKHQTAGPRSHGGYGGQNGKQGNSFLQNDMQISRTDSKKMTGTAPQMTKQHSNREGGNQFKTSNEFGGMKRQEEDKDVTELKVKLKQTSAQFLEQMKSNRQDEIKKQINEIRLNLNILTPTNFSNIRGYLLEMSTKDDQLCEIIVEGIIEKARTQKTYSQMYAELCKYILNEAKVLFPPTGELNEQGKPIEHEKSKVFKNKLYTNIQKTFEGQQNVYDNKMTHAKKRDLSELKTADDKMIYFMDKKKREMLNVQFIGNLYLNKSMNAKILSLCCSSLISHFFSGFCTVPEEQRDSDELEEGHFEDRLEALVGLFEQTGPTQHKRHEQSKKQVDNSAIVNAFTQSVLEARNDKTKTNSALQAEFEAKSAGFNYEDYFSLFDWLKKERLVSPRLYSLITNLIERKEENWKERLSAQSGPLSYDKLKQNHQDEMQQTQKEIANYEQEMKGKGGRHGHKGGNKHDDKKGGKPLTKYVAVSKDSKMPLEKTMTRVKEIWQGIDTRTKQGDDNAVIVEQGIADLKKLFSETSPANFGESVLKTVYDCNVNLKQNRLAVAHEAIALLKPDEFVAAFNNRLNKSKDENSDYPLFLSFLSTIFLKLYSAPESTIKYSQLKIGYKPEYSQDDKEDVVFVYKLFFEETIDLIKANKESNIEIASFVDEQAKPVLSSEDEMYSRWEGQMKK